MQWNTSVRAEPSAVQRPLPRKQTRMPACCVLAVRPPARRGLTLLSGSALQSWVAEVYEEHLLWRDECGGDPQPGGDRRVLTGYCFTQHVRGARIHRRAQRHCGAERSRAALGE